MNMSWDARQCLAFGTHRLRTAPEVRIWLRPQSIRVAVSHQNRALIDKTRERFERRTRGIFSRARPAGEILLSTDSESE